MRSSLVPEFNLFCVHAFEIDQVQLVGRGLRAAPERSVWDRRGDLHGGFGTRARHRGDRVAIRAIRRGDLQMPFEMPRIARNSGTGALNGFTSGWISQEFLFHGSQD